MDQLSRQVLVGNVILRQSGLRPVGFVRSTGLDEARLSQSLDITLPRAVTDSCRAAESAFRGVRQSGLLICIAFAALLIGCRPASEDTSVVVVQPSELVPFEELFVFEDSLVLDPSVILGRIWFVDVDASGSILITDMASDLVHLFAPTGEHQASFSMDTCLPTDDGLDPWAAQFAENDRVVLSDLSRSMVVFNRSGECLVAKRLTSRSQSFCTRGDSIYTFRGLQRLTTSIMDVYSIDLELEREIVLPTPEFPRLNQSYLGVSGRDFACFDSGPWYKYPEEMDASPVYALARVTRAQPDFFVRRDRDLREGLSWQEESEERNAFPLLVGMYALDHDTRLGLFSRIGDEFRTENTLERFPWGLSIVSNSGKFRARSTVPYKAPKAARHGFLYFLGDHVPMEDGDVGNPVVIRYRFKVPDDG